VKAWMLATGIGLVSVPVGCGGSGGHDGHGGSAAMNGNRASIAPPSTKTPATNTACGSVTCASGQRCCNSACQPAGPACQAPQPGQEGAANPPPDAAGTGQTAPALPGEEGGACAGSTGIRCNPGLTCTIDPKDVNTADAGSICRQPPLADAAGTCEKL
jgi:hypothetical protein